MTTRRLSSEAQLYYLDPEAYDLRKELREQLYALSRMSTDLDMKLHPKDWENLSRDHRVALPNDRIELLVALINVNKAKLELVSTEMKGHTARLTEEVRKLAKK